jgi:hypothetical protein
MTRFTFGAYETQTASPADFSQVVEVVKGRSITSLADWGANRFELGLSGNVMLRIFASGTDIEINCFSTQNQDEPLASALPLGEMPEMVSVWHLEAKLRGLRTAFGIFYLLASERERELAEYLVQHPFGDIDRALLTDGEALRIESLSYGSWVATVRTKTRAAINALVAIATIVFPRSRDAFLKKLEAEASLKGTEAKRSEVALARDKFELAKDQTEYALDLANRMGDRKTREVLLRRLRHAIYDLASGDRDETEIRDVTRRIFPTVEADGDEDNGTE